MEVKEKEDAGSRQENFQVTGSEIIKIR